MYAIFETGGKQYRVEPGDILDVELLHADSGEVIDFDRVLAVSTDESVVFGTPVVEGAKVSAKLVENHRGRKITVFKMKRRKGYRRKQGHRQNLSRIEVVGIDGGK